MGVPLAARVSAAVQRARRRARHAESNDDETDLDQTLVATWTTVLANTRGQHGSLGLTKEQTTHSNQLLPLCSRSTRHARSVEADDRGPGALLPPILGYLSMNAQADDAMDFSLDELIARSRTRSRGSFPTSSDVMTREFGARFTYVWISNPNNSNANGTYSFPGDQTFNPAVPGTYRGGSAASACRGRSTLRPAIARVGTVCSRTSGRRATVSR